jgi:TOBE domain-containing protein
MAIMALVVHQWRSSDTRGADWCTPSRQVRRGDRLQLALRPGKIDMSPSPMAPGAGTSTGTIRHVVYLGTVPHYYVTSEAGEAFVIHCQSQAPSHPRRPLRVGDAIHLFWRPEHTLMLENNAEPSDLVAVKESG